MARCRASNSSRSGTTSPFLSSVRWLAMMRRASFASLSRTAILTSPALSTDSGNTEREMPDEVTVMRPWASSRLRTTRASMSEGVVKMTTSSGNGFVFQTVHPAGGIPLVHLIHFEQNHCHIIVLRRVADERGDLPQHPLAQLVRRQVRVPLDELPQPVLAEAIVVRVHRLADAVGEEQVEIARVHRNRLLLQEAFEHLPAVDLEAEHQAVGRQNLHVPAGTAAR